jgi:hypothetical protein
LRLLLIVLRINLAVAAARHGIVIYDANAAAVLAMFIALALFLLLLPTAVFVVAATRGCTEVLFQILGLGEGGHWHDDHERAERRRATRAHAPS